MLLYSISEIRLKQSIGLQHLLRIFLGGRGEIYMCRLLTFGFELRPVSLSVDFPE